MCGTPKQKFLDDVQCRRGAASGKDSFSTYPQTAKPSGKYCQHLDWCSPGMSCPEAVQLTRTTPVKLLWVKTVSVAPFLPSFGCSPPRCFGGSVEVLPEEGHQGVEWPGLSVGLYW